MMVVEGGTAGTAVACKAVLAASGTGDWARLVTDKLSRVGGQLWGLDLSNCSP